MRERPARTPPLRRPFFWLVNDRRSFPVNGLEKNNVPAPIGNQNAKVGRVWTQAIQRALAKRSGAKKIEAMDELAERLLAKCDDGDMAALKELGDRLEGKSTTIIAGDDTRPPIAVIAHADTGL